MPISEFELIKRYFTEISSQRADVLLGVGDDCALITPPPGKQLAITTDTLVSGVHFFADVDPFSLGHKSLAVNLSDLAAMGAEPAWVTLALSLPEVDELWLQEFCRGFAQLASEFNVQLIGGDTTRGPLSITVQAIGLSEPGKSLRRDAAQPGELVYVSGTLGDAALALSQCQSKGVGQVDPALLTALQQPVPQVSLGLAIRDHVNCGIDISDGLLADVGHISASSNVSIVLNLSQLPCSDRVVAYLDNPSDYQIPLCGGDDYQLCFTVTKDNRQQVESLAENLGVQITCVGEVLEGAGVKCLDEQGQEVEVQKGGFDHFKA